MMMLFRAVTAHGTGAAVAALKHPLGGKTGTTSDFTDAWFLGFSPSVTCGVWVGYDSRQSLGEKETGARAALPIWIDFMRAAIAGKDDEQFLADQSDSSLDQATAAPEKPAVPAPAPIQSPPKVRPASIETRSTGASIRTAAVTRPRAVGNTASLGRHP